MNFAANSKVADGPPSQRPCKGKDGKAGITKPQGVIIVSTAATIFILWPERYILFRNLCLVPLLGWLTALAFDLKDTVDGAWNGVPAWMKRMIVGSAGSPQDASTKKMSVREADSAETWEQALHHLVKVLHFLGRKAAKASMKCFEILLAGLFELGPLLSPSETEVDLLPELVESIPEKSLKSTEYYGILVRSPSIHDYGSIQPRLGSLGPTLEPIDWNSKKSGSIPSIGNPPTFRAHLSFCLVEKDIWDSKSLTLLNKLTTGSYWDITGEDGGSSGKSRTRQAVCEINGVEVLGVVDGKYDAIEKCSEYFDALKKDWQYLKISWNDVDFAIILGFLVTGAAAKEKSTELFKAFDQARMEQVLRLRAQTGPRFAQTGISIAAVSAIATVATGGLAAPFAFPLMAGSAMTGIGSAFAESQISERDRKMLEQRRASCQNLEKRFPQLKPLFEMEQVGDNMDTVDEGEEVDPAIWDSTVWDALN